MLLAIHGQAGGWDELIIAVVALAVLWIAVKLAGRKPADQDDDSPDDASREAAGGRTGDVTPETATQPATQVTAGVTPAASEGQPAQPPSGSIG